MWMFQVQTLFTNKNMNCRFSFISFSLNWILVLKNNCSKIYAFSLIFDCIASLFDKEQLSSFGHIYVVCKIVIDKLQPEQQSSSSGNPIRLVCTSLFFRDNIRLPVLGLYLDLADHLRRWNLIFQIMHSWLLVSVEHYTCFQIHLKIGYLDLDSN